MKKIVTHLNPDLDAIASIWLIKRFLSDWKEAEIGFEPAREIKNPDDDPDVLYVDMGSGQLDHHQTSEYLSAAKLCFDFVKRQRKGQSFSPLEEKSLAEMVSMVTEVDNARDLTWPEVKESRYKFYLHNLIGGLKGLAASDEEVMSFGFKSLDTVLLNLKSKIRAQEELEEGLRFETPWGEAIGVASGNKSVLWEGEVQGFCLVVQKDPEDGAVGIYARPDTRVDLTEAYNRVKKLDPKSDWFLHASKRLLLNKASVNPGMRPTKLSLEKIIEVLKK